jgi:hypothetical protein
MMFEGSDEGQVASDEIGGQKTGEQATGVSTACERINYIIR